MRRKLPSPTALAPVRGPLALLALLAAHSQAAWLAPREYRRPLSAVPNAHTVVVKFNDGAHLTSSGVLVVDSRGNVLPSAVLFSRRGEVTWVAFNGAAAKGQVALYYGPSVQLPGAQLRRVPAGGWQPRLSLFLFTMPAPPGALQSHKPIAAAFRERRFFGLGPVDKVFHGFNPFGPDDNYASYYLGYLVIRKSGKYRIFTSSDEASFVFLDDRPLCSWPGSHQAHAGRRGKFGADVHLTRGEHKLEYYHVETTGEQCAALGWTPPGEKGYRIVPASAFLHVPVARAGAPERFGGRPLAAFQWSQDDQVLHENYQFTRISFASQCRNLPKGAKFVWDFGDRLSARVPEPEHVYLGAGPFPCTLKVLDEKGKLLDHFSAVIRPDEAIKNFTINDRHIVHRYVQAICKTDCSRLPPSTLDALWELVETEEDPALVLPFAETYVERLGLKGKGWHAGDYLALAYSVKNPEAAVKLYTRLAASAPTKLDAARAQLERIEIILHKLDNPELAMKVARAVRASRGGLEARVAAVKIGDIHRAQGDFEKAEKAYRQAQDITYAKMDPRVIAVRQGGYLETVNSFLEHGYLRAAREALVMWEIEHPIGKLSGDLILMTARYFDKLGEPRRALAELETLTKLNPLTPYLPEVELLKARAYRKMGNEAKARELYQKVMDEYPRSRAARVARDEFR